MPTEKSGLIIPVVLWGPKAPRSRIVQITALQNGKTIVTGSEDGTVVQWSVDESLGWIQPQMMMLAHQAAVSCISPVSASPSSTEFLTCSDNGHICLWNSVDGRIIDSARTNYVHRKMKPYTLKNGLQKVLLCVGDYPDVLALHPSDLNVLYTLNSRAEPDWITSITLVQPKEQYDVLVGISLSGVAKLWSLHELNLKECSGANNILFEDESKFIASRNVRSIACSERNLRMMLVVCANSWQIIDPSNFNQLIISECAIEALEGIIVDVDKVAVGFADSTIVLFQLPRNKLTGKQIRERFGTNPANVANIEQPFVFALLKGVPSPKTTSLQNPVKFYFDSMLSADGRSSRRVAYRVDEHGALSFWHVPKNLELLVSEFVRTRRPIVYEPTIKQSFAEAWARLTPTPPSIAQFEDNHSITATVYVATQGKLFLGRDNGSILMMNACHAIMVSLLEGFGNESAPYRSLEGGHTAPVNCFLYPFDEHHRYDPNLLLSGGADFAVIVWNITLGERVHRFCCQGGPVLRMLVPPPNCSLRILNCVCAIAADNSACLLSLKELKSILLASRQQYPIVDVRWRPLDDLMLLRCEDDSVYVWQIETGNLDRIITGLIADEIMEACSEQQGVNYEDTQDEAGASQAIQMLRAVKHKNFAVVMGKASKSGKKSGTPPPKQSSSTIDICCSSSPRRGELEDRMEPSSSSFHQEGEEFRSKIAGHDEKGLLLDSYQFSAERSLAPPIDVVQLKQQCSDQTHLILFNLDALISGLLLLDYELHSSTQYSTGTQQIFGPPNSLAQNGDVLPNLHPKLISTNSLAQQHSLYMDTAKLLISLVHAWGLDEAVDSICINDLKVFRPRIPICFGTISKGHFSLYTPYSSGRIPALDDFSFAYFSKNIHWQMSRALTTFHLMAVVALSNTLMALRNRSYQLSSKKTPLRRALSSKSTDEPQLNELESLQIKQGWSNVAALHCVLLPDLVRPRGSYASPMIDMLARKWQDNCIEIRDAAQAILIRELNRLGSDGRQQLVTDLANFLPTQLDPSISIFGTQLANAMAAATAENVGNHVQQQYQGTNNIAESLAPTNQTSLSVTNSASGTATPSRTPPPRPNAPPIPPRNANSTSSLPQLVGQVRAFGDSASTSSTTNSTMDNNQQYNRQQSASAALEGVSVCTAQTMGTTDSVGSSSAGDAAAAVAVAASLSTGKLTCEGLQQIRRNQATSIIVLGVMGAEFPNELQSHLDICRATAQSLLELLLAPESPYVPVPQNSLLRRAAIDLLGRGFAIWQPHLDLSKVLIGLLNLAAECERHLPSSPPNGAQLSSEADACRTARHALSLIATSRPQALINALSMEVVRYNAVVQHQTIQHPIASPLMKARSEVLRLLEQLSDKQYNFVVDLIVPVGDILVHCLDLAQLKQHSLGELFPPIARFYMVAYCPTTRRLAFGGKNGVIVIHELRASKAQSVKAHNVPITALAFSQDGKYLAAYAAQEAKISFWQTQQTFLGMGQSQIRCAKTLPAPGEFPVISPGGSYQLFRARLVWINSKALTLMLPNGKENRFSV